MDRRAAAGFALGLLLVCGCAHDGSFNIEKLLGWDDGKPAAPKVTAASLQTSERVDSLGRRVVAQNPFCGIEPLFNTVGLKETVLFHDGPSMLYVSEGLVVQCKTEPELAAVLCSELGKMVAEKRGAAAVGKDRDSIRNVSLPDGGGFDAGQAEELARKDAAKRKFTADETSAEAVARSLMSGAGYDPAVLEQVKPLLRQSERGEAIRKQMVGTAPAPKWER
jgi:hypothetical protein